MKKGTPMNKLLAITVALALPLKAMNDEQCRTWTPRLAATIIGVTFTYVLWNGTQPLEECGCFQGGSMTNVKLRPLGECEANCKDWCVPVLTSEAACAPSKYFWEFLKDTNRTSILD